METSKAIKNLSCNPALLQEALCHSLRLAIYGALDNLQDTPRVLAATAILTDFCDENGLSGDDAANLLEIDRQSVGVLAALSPSFPVREIGLMTALDSDGGFSEIKSRVCSVLAAAYRGALYKIIDTMSGTGNQEALDAAVLLDNVMRTERMTLQDLKDLADFDLAAVLAANEDVA